MIGVCLDQTVFIFSLNVTITFISDIGSLRSKRSHRSASLENLPPWCLSSCLIPSCWSAFLLLEIFTGSRTSYSHNPDLPVGEFPQVVGKQTVDSRPGTIPECFFLDPWSSSLMNSEVGPVGREKAASGNEALTGWCF